ncbi:mycocerosic acid synthase-like [Mytilus edulis]|uniref:mycocerosic acid synthase-like n=1 Tax=Mytilus edulis TaxID=6550 RepID=UPI0039EEB1F2
MEEIAIVGIACRFPGGKDIDEFWEVLKNGEDHVLDVPKERWNVDIIDIPDLDDEWKEQASKSGLIQDYDKWDNKLFGISESEAGWMDPQQCLALEVTYSALEDGGFTREKIKGTNTGVYIGCMNKDLSLGLNESLHEFNNFLVTGMSSSIISNRLSYFFDIRGPSLTIDTACSSALVAIHLGCQAIRSGDCSMAICGGVNSMITPINYIPLIKAGMTSKTGKSHTFSKDADGYARGEGCGMVVLKSLKQAKKDGDKIWAVIMSGCNQDGKENTPITAPSGKQQIELMERLYSLHGISPADIQYIESHGTGTPIGDPTETNALAEFFSPFLSKDRKIPIGSVKTNIGHLESSAGTAGLIKVLLMMKHAKIVPSLHYSKENANPNIDFDSIPLEVSTDIRIWKERNDGTRISCINSFGFGGTNSHAVIKQLAKTVPIKDSSTCKPITVDFIIAISAASQEALTYTVKHYIQKIKTESYNIQELSFTSLMKRSHYRYRLAVVTHSTNDLEEQLTAINTTADEISKKIKPVQLIFLFCGVGTVWVGMCQGFLNKSKIFKDTVMKIDNELIKYTKISILDTLKNPSSTFLRDPFLGPLAIFTCQIGIWDMWQDKGVTPDLIVGQSVGEVAAAYASGCLTLSEAVQVTYYRSFLSSKAAGGKMLIVGHINTEKLEEICSTYGTKLAIAVYSSKETCVVSGDENSINDLKEIMSSNSEYSSVLLKELDVTCAYHSYHMTDASKQLKSELANLHGKTTEVPIISTVSGQQINGPEMGSAAYWSSNLLKPVLLKQAISKAINPDKNNIFIEIGPKPILRAHLKKITDDTAMAIPSSNNPDEHKTFMKAISELYTHNVFLKLDKLCTLQPCFTDVPRYQFHRSGKLLISNNVRASLQANVSKGSTHPFVTKQPLSDGFKVTLSKEKTSYIYDHVLDKQHIVPGAIHAEIGLAVSKRHSTYPLTETSIGLHFMKPIGVGQNLPVELEVDVSTKNCTFDIRRKKQIICKGRYFETKTSDLVNVNIDEIKQVCPIHVSEKLFYDTLRDLGFEYGQMLSVIGESWRSDSEYFAEMKVPNEVASEMQTMHLHPCILDGILQTLSLLWIATLEKYEKNAADVSRPIPIKIGALTVRKPPQKKMFVYGKLTESTVRHTFLNILLLTENGEVVATIENYEVKNIAPGLNIYSISEKTYEIRWLPVQEENLDRAEECLEYTLFVFLTSASYDKSKSIFADSTSLAVLLDVAKDKVFDSNELLQQLQTALDGKQMKWNSISCIVYFPGFNHFTHDLDTNTIYHCIKVSCLVLLKMLQKFVAESIDNPIYVITENTQPHCGGQEGVLYNVTGSELWGMCRCLVRERTYSNLKLVDLTDALNVTLLPLIVMNSGKDGQLNYTPEFQCSGGVIYMNQIVRLSDDSYGHRINRYNQYQQLELRSNDFKNMESLFFVEKNTRMMFDETKHELMQIENAVVIPKMSPVTTTMAIDDPDPWKYAREDGHSVIATEYFGKITSKYKTNSHSLNCLHSSRIYPAKSDSQNTSFVSCFPNTVSNTVFVPKSCLIPKVAFNNHYRPGLMHECVLYLSILEVLKQKSPIGIIYDKSLCIDISILTSILNASKYKVVFCLDVFDFLEKCSFGGKCQLVLFVEKMTCLAKCTTKFSVVASRIIAVSQFIDKAKERALRQRLADIDICIINYDEILSEPRLGKLVKALQILLSKNCIKGLPAGHEKKYVVNFDCSYHDENATNALDIAVKIDKHRIFHRSAGYLITGGLSGLGWEIVNLIARMGGGCIAIVARSTPTVEKLLEIQSLKEKHDCKIISLKGDVADYESLKQALDIYKAEFPSHPLKGIFHGAAVVDDAIIVHMTDTKFEKVLKPKVLGTLNLHNLTRDMKLDYFVMHSSITSVFGNTGQTNYGAGNAFMDTFAFYRRSMDLCGQTINWGALHLGILTASEHVERYLNSQGYQSLNPEEIMECLIHTLCKNFTQIVYGIFEWETIIRLSPDMLHLTSKLQPLLTELNLIDIFTSKPSHQHIDIDVDEILKLPQEKRFRKIVEALRMIVADAFAIELLGTDEKTLLVDLGIDSMKAMSLINNIYLYLSCKIPVIAVLDPDANIDKIAEIIVQEFAVSFDACGMVPVDKILGMKNYFRERYIDLNFIEKEMYDCQTRSPTNYNYLQVKVAILNESTDLKTIQQAFFKLKTVYEFLDSIYIQDGESTVRIAWDVVFQEQEFESSNKALVHTIETMQPEHEFDRRFRDARFPKDPGVKLTNKSVVFEGRILKILLDKTEECSYMIILCDRIFFDQKSALQLTMEFLSLFENDTVSADNHFHDNATARELDDAFERFKGELDSFWPSLLSHNIKPIVISDQITDTRSDIDITVTSSQCTLKTSISVREFLRKNRISIQEFFITIYQIFLHLATDNEVVSVASYVDIRPFIDRNNICGGLENCVPFIAQFQNDNQEVSSFLRQNVDVIRKSTQLGLMSPKYMEDMFTNTLGSVNAFMHGVAVDQTDFDDHSPESKMRVNSIINFESRFFTKLHIQDRGSDQPIMLILHANPKFVQMSTSTKILEGLQKITEAIFAVETVTLTQIKSKFPALSNHPLNGTVNGRTVTIVERGHAQQSTEYKNNDIVYEGMFQKETSYGWDHPVLLRIKNNGIDKKILQWNAGRRTKEVSAMSIRSAKCSWLNGMAVVVIQTNTRQYNFKTSDKDEAESFWKFMELIRSDDGSSQSSSHQLVD